MTLRIMLVDDHELLRRGVRELLAEQLSDVELFEAGTGEDALAMVGDERWDLIVLDLAMPKKGGFEVLRALQSTRPEIPVVILSASEDEHYAVRAIRAGARGYVTKQTTATELVGAVQRAIAGERYVSPELGARIAEAALDPRVKEPHERLSERELQVLRMLATGKSVKDIGIELTLSEKTVSTYRARLLQKLELSSNAEVMRYALRTGLVEL